MISYMKTDFLPSLRHTVWPSIRPAELKIERENWRVWCSRPVNRLDCWTVGNPSVFALSFLRTWYFETWKLWLWHAALSACRRNARVWRYRQASRSVAAPVSCSLVLFRVVISENVVFWNLKIVTVACSLICLPVYLPVYGEGKGEARLLTLMPVRSIGRPNCVCMGGLRPFKIPSVSNLLHIKDNFQYNHIVNFSCSLPGYDIMYPHRWLQKFHRNLLPPSSGYNISVPSLLIPVLF
jgi:hypothetical protein